MGITYIENYAAWASAAASSIEVTSMVNPSSTFSIVAGNRAGGYALQASFPNNTAAYYTKTMLRTPSTVWVAWRSVCDEATSSGANMIVSLGEAAGNTHVVFAYDASYQLVAYNHDKSVTYGTVSGLTQGAWHQFVAKVVISDTVGSIEIRMDGDTTPAVNVTSLDTKNAGSGVVSRITIGDTAGAPIGASGTIWRIMDLAVWDNDGNSPSGWVGDVRVDDYAPDGAGSSTQWTPLSSTNYSNVDEAAANEDTDYVYASISGKLDYYTIADITHNPTTIYSVSTSAVAKKTDASFRGFNLKMLSNSVTSTGPSVTLTNGTYLRYYAHYGADPGTSSEWTVAKFNAIEAGMTAGWPS
jgi:hypothetical protein